MRPVLLVAVFSVYLLLTVGVRSWIHYRRTGATGFRGVSGTPGSLEWFGGVLFVIAMGLALAAPLLALSRLDPPRAAQSLLVDVVGAIFVALGVVGTWWAQGAMGASWRIGVDGSERTGLVTAGPFALVRNPIFTFMMLSAAGLVLLLLNVSVVLALLLLIVAIELQVRSVEEPYLRRVHGEAYEAYGQRVGRFVPGVGRF